MKKHIVNVSGPWEFREFPETARRMSDLEEGRWLQITQPESIFLSLAEMGVLHLADVYTQPQAFGWVSRRAWVYRTWFELSEDHLAADCVELVFEGLDTVAQIWLNEKLLGRTENMFISHRFDVSSRIRPGRNDLVIQFQPAEEHADKLMQRYAKTGNPPFDIPSSAYLRKARYQFGSAMGPSLPGCGILGPVRLELAHTADIRDVHLRTIDCGEHFADIRAAVVIRRMEQVGGRELRCVLRIEGDGTRLSHTLDFGSRQDRISTVLRLDHPILWQPKGYGRPYRYTVSAELYCGDELLDVREIPFGIRTVRISHPRESESDGILLEVNHQAIETKGVHWTPLGLIRDGNEQAKKERLLYNLTHANINLLRVWGGGHYEDEVFYDLCDRLGIIVWQDLMFAPACSIDPVWFTDQFRPEVEQIVRQMRNHACLVGWCGGEQTDDSHKTDSSKKRKKEQNDNFQKTLTELLSEWDPDRDYVPATLMSAPEDGVASPSMPCIETLQMACRKDELFLGSVHVENQSYFPEGLSLLVRQTNAIFAPPKTLEEQIYQSQVAQARSMKKNTESVRSGCGPQWPVMPWTAGQFWPGMGFSMLDFAEKQTAMYFYAKRSLAPILICLTDKKDLQSDIQLSYPNAAVVVNGSAEPLTGNVVFELLDMKGRMLDTSEFPMSIGPCSKSTAIVLPRAFLEPLFPEKSILRLAVVGNNQMICENLYGYVPDKYAAFKPMEIDLTIRPVTEKKVLLDLQSRYFVKDLEIVPVQNAHLSDNFFDLLPGRTYEVTIDFAEPITRPDTPFVLRSVCGI
jgi:beta-mannosidase